jgi:hypothetical protein
MAKRTPALGKLRVGANTGRASSRSPMAARRRSMDRSSGLASRLFAGEAACSCALLVGGCSAAEGGVSINLLAKTVAGYACEPAFGGDGRRGSGQGFQPSRRRIFRTAFSLRPSRPAIHRLLIPLALRRRIVLSRSWFPLCLAGLPEGRPSGRASALSPPTLRRS